MYLWLFKLNNGSGKYFLEGDTIQYIYTNSKHNNHGCRAIPIENLRSILAYDKYGEMVLDATETASGVWLS